jgi:hypothetical protein
MIRLILAIWSLLQGKTYVSDFKTINGSVWWDNEREKTVASFERIYSTTAIGKVTPSSAYIYLPSKIQVRIQYHENGKEASRQYLAQLKLHKVMLRHELERWIDRVAKHPFV